MNKKIKGFLVALIIGGIILTGAGVVAAGSRNADRPTINSATYRFTGNEDCSEHKQGRESAGEYGFAGSARNIMEKIASYFGITKDALKAERRDGKSLTEIAEANGITQEELVNFITSSRTEQLQAFLDEGIVDQTRYETMLNAFSERVTEMVERTEIGPRSGAFGTSGHGRLRKGTCTP
ncbi:MAG: hypothetical protein U9Q18_05660 [Caldisericota bacterium]|nr:hypothetical protein [Caldisericota bacterium]